VVNIRNDACRFVSIKGTLERAHQQIAFLAVVVDDSQTAITSVVLRLEVFANVRDVGNLPLNNEELVFLNLCQSNFIQLLQRQGFSHAVFQLPLYALEEGFELFKILTNGAICNLFSGTLFSGTTYVAKFGNAAGAGTIVEFRSKFIEVRFFISCRGLRWRSQ